MEEVSQGTVKVVWYSYLFKNFPEFVVIHTVLDKTLENTLDSKESQPINHKEISLEYWKD